MNLTVIILTKNSELNLEKALKSVEFADEIIVLDDRSHDRTEEIALKYTSKIFKSPLNDDFGAQRNYGLKQAKGDWILYVDSDEIITPELQIEIQKVLKSKDQNLGYYIKRRDIFWGRVLKYGELWNSYREGIIRLFKKNSGLWEHPVHEKFVHKGYFGVLNNYIDHYSHNGIKDFIENVNYYSTIRAKELLKKGKVSNIFQIFIYPIGKFTVNYLFKLGFLDGVEGFIYAFMMSFHSFLVRAKLYQYTRLSN